jgi:hypothetical protein
MERAGMLARQGRTEEAFAEAARDLAERRAAALARPDDPVSQRSWLVALRPVADMKAVSGHRSEACADYQAALAAWTAFDRRHELTAQTRDTEIARLKRETARCRRERQG